MIEKENQFNTQEEAMTTTEVDLNAIAVEVERIFRENEETRGTLTFQDCIDRAMRLKGHSPTEETSVREQVSAKLLERRQQRFVNRERERIDERHNEVLGRYEKRD